MQNNIFGIYLIQKVPRSANLAHILRGWFVVVTTFYRMHLKNAPPFCSSKGAIALKKTTKVYPSWYEL